MSDEIKKTVLNTLAEPIANSAKNITDKPTQNMGATIADIWYLVFGGISQAAEKRKLKYSYALQKFEKELEKEIFKIPEQNKIEPDIQIVAKALEESKYCVEKEELRFMFSKMIAASMDRNKCNKVHPIFSNIIRLLSPLEANILKELYEINHNFFLPPDKENFLASLSILECQGLIYTTLKDCGNDFECKDVHTLKAINDNRTTMVLIFNDSKDIKINLTDLGLIFCNICLSDD